VSRRVAIALAAAAVAALAAPSVARAEEAAWEGAIGLEAGGGYAIAAPRTAAAPSSLSGGAFRARIWYGLTDALGVAVTGQISWFQGRRPLSEIQYEDETGALVSGLGYGAAITQTRLQDLGGSLIYALDVLRVVPFLAAGVASLRAVETGAAGERIEHDVVLRFEIGVDVAALARFRIGASATFDTFLTQRADFTAQTAFLIRAAVVLGPAVLGRR
jgi:hypothetical protein